MKMAVIKTGGKQYLVKEGAEIVVDKLVGEPGTKLKLQTLATLDTDTHAVELGAPSLKKEVEATVLNQVKGDKIRVARFKAKVRYRRVSGFRPQLTKLKIVKLN